MSVRWWSVWAGADAGPGFSCRFSRLLGLAPGADPGTAPHRGQDLAPRLRVERPEGKQQRGLLGR